MAEKFSGIVNTFDDCATPWWCVQVPDKISQPYKPLARNFGFIAVTLRVGESSWDSSLMPDGGGAYFIAIPAKIRKANDIKLGDKVLVEFEIRER
jgi:Domain of unknown function (DUF1905).